VAQKRSGPGESELRKILGGLYPSYGELLELTAPYTHEWKSYGRAHGWQLKIAGKGKAMLYLSVQERSFRVGFAIRDKEREALLNSGLPDGVKADLEAAKRYPEGFPLRFSVKGRSDVAPVRMVIEQLMSMRASG